LVLEKASKDYQRPELSVDEIEATGTRREQDRIARALSHRIPRNAYYFPASRSGFMQTYGALTALVWGALGSGYFEQATVGAIPGTAADFLQLLARMRPSSNGGLGAEAVRTIEQRLLGGSITLDQHDAVRQVLFHPNGFSQSWPIEAAATGAAEVAPLVLFLKHQARPGDALFIDEPEAHFHPANQVVLADALTEVADALGAVVIATHSEFLVSQLSNVMLERSRRSEPQARIGAFLGVYEFIPSTPREGVTVSELRFDPSQGFEISQFADVADDTYRRALELYEPAEPLKKK
jgi:predicted ATPase